MTPFHHQSRRDYFAANAPAGIPEWFCFDYPPKPKLPDRHAELSEQHRKQWEGLGDWLEDHEVDAEVLAFRERYHAALKATDQHEKDFAVAQFLAWRFRYADMMIAASTAPAATPLDDHAHTAMCIWEWLIPHSERDTQANALKRRIGTVELRRAAIALVPFCQQVYAALPDAVTDMNTYDWDIIPAILDTIDWSGERPQAPPLDTAIAAVTSAFSEQRPVPP